MKDELIRTVADGFSLLAFLLRGRSIARLQDLHVVSEDFMRASINCIRGLNLVNLNKEDRNYPALDLGDKGERIGFQVSTNRSATKIQSRLDIFDQHGMSRDYDKAIFIVLGKRQKQYTTLRSQSIQFDPEEHVVDLLMLTREASNLDTSKLAELAKIIENDGLMVSNLQDSDTKALKIVLSHFDRDALKHRWHQEGSITGFAAALTELTELLGKGTIKGNKITKPIHMFADENVAKEFTPVKNALGSLKAAFNERVNSKEIRSEHEFAFFKDRETAEAMNAAKQKIIDEINRIATRHDLPPISMNTFDPN